MSRLPVWSLKFGVAAAVLLMCCSGGAQTNTPFTSLIETNQIGTNAQVGVFINLGTTNSRSVRTSFAAVIQNLKTNADLMAAFQVIPQELVVTNVVQFTNYLKSPGVSNVYRLGAGYYELGGASFILSNSPTIIGAGRGLTVLNGTPPVGQIFTLSNNVRFANCTVQITNPSVQRACFAMAITPSADAYTGIEFDSCDLIGETDIFFPWRGYGQLRNCRLFSSWDAVVQTAGVITQYNCSYKILGRKLGANNGLQTIAVVMNAGTNIMKGGLIDVRGGIGYNYGIDVSTVGCRAELEGVTIRAASGLGLNYSVNNQASGVLIVKNCFFDAAVNGPVTESDAYLPPQAGSLGRQVWKALGASGRYTNSAGDRYVAFDVSSVAGTNTLPDIGFQSVLSVTVSNQPVDGNTYVISGETFTWRNSPVGDHEVQIGVNQSGSAGELSIALLPGLAIDGAYTQTTPTPTNVTTAGRGDVIISHSATGTWAVLTASTNDFGTQDGRLITVVDVNGSAGTRNITVKPQRNAKINSAASYTINNNNGAATFQAIGTNWVVINKF